MPSVGVYPSVGLTAYDERWPARFREVSASLADALGGWEVEHIGSTSVPGLVAKPVIDLAVRVPDGLEPTTMTRALVDAGWTAPEDIGSHWCAFLLEDGVRAAIAHFFLASDWETAHQRLFASWLREHPSDRDVYAQLKLGLREAGVWGQAYTRAKTDFVQGVVDRARAERGLPPIPVWDKV